MDAGPIIDQESIPITVDDTGASLRNKLAKACVPVIDRNLTELLSGEAKEREQDPNGVTYCRKLGKRIHTLIFLLPQRNWSGGVVHLGHGQSIVFFYEDIPLRVGNVKSLTQNIKTGELIVENSKLMLGTGEGTLADSSVTKAWW